MLRTKTPTGLLVGVFLCLLVACGDSASTDFVRAPGPVPPACELAEAVRQEWVELAAVVDGDTLRLQDGRTVRVLGINAPELGRRGQPGEPFSRVARDAARTFFKYTSPGRTQRIGLVPGQEQEDRYGRLLAHVYRSDGASLEEHLLAQGLAFHSPVPPNLARSTCYSALEEQARKNRVGIWSDDGIRPIEARKVDRGGYQRVRGQVTSVSLRRNWWLELDGGFTVVVHPADQGRFDREQIIAWEDRLIEIQGWVYSVRGEFRMKLETPWVIRAVP